MEKEFLINVLRIVLFEMESIIPMLSLANYLYKATDWSVGNFLLLCHPVNLDDRTFHSRQEKI